MRALTVRRIGLLGFALAVALIALAAWGSYRAVADLGEATRGVRQTLRVRQQAARRREPGRHGHRHLLRNGSRSRSRLTWSSRFQNLFLAMFFSCFFLIGFLKFFRCELASQFRTGFEHHA